MALIRFMIVVAAVIALPSVGHAKDKVAHEKIVEVVTAYVEGFYLLKPELIAQSVSKDLSKTGYLQTKEGYREDSISYERLYEVSKRYNADDHVDPATARKDIVVLDVLDQIALVKLSADWGVDYISLAKEEGGWKIVKVLWQTYPR